MIHNRTRAIAYLSPALPALTETFVYEELLAVERRGFRIVPVSVHLPATPVPTQMALAQRVIHLYSGTAIALALSGMARLPFFGKGAWIALKYLASDILECGALHVGTWKLAYQFLVATKLARILIRENCTHLHVHFADTPAQIAMYASALANVPFTIMAHANDIFDGGLLLRRKAERAIRVLTISEYNVRYLESLGIPRDRISIVRCGVSFTPRHRVTTPANEAPFRIGSLGRMVEKKGFDVLIRAVAILKAAGHNIQLCIAGDGPLMADLQQLVRDLDIAQIVRFQGSMSHDQVSAWLQQLDVFVLACKQDKNGDIDGIPVVLMEAMSQSISVISTRLSGIPELVIHKTTGLLAEPNDSDDLAHQIDYLMKSDKLCGSLIKNAVDHVTHEFGQELNVNRLIRHFITWKP